MIRGFVTQTEPAFELCSSTLIQTPSFPGNATAAASVQEVMKLEFMSRLRPATDVHLLIMHSYYSDLSPAVTILQLWCWTERLDQLKP